MCETFLISQLYHCIHQLHVFYQPMENYCTKMNAFSTALNIHHIHVILFYSIYNKQLIYLLTSLTQILFFKYLSFKLENHESENTYLMSSSITTCWEGASNCQSYPLFDNVRLPKYTGLPECDWKADFIESGNNHSD